MTPDPKRKPGRPPSPNKRVSRTFSVAPETEEKILAHAKEQGVSNGVFLDKLVDEYDQNDLRIK